MHRRRGCSWLLLAAAGCATAAPPPSRPAPSSGVAADIAYLASTHLAGREVGSAGGDTAAVFIADRYTRLGVRGAFDEACSSSASCEAGYFQVFDAGGQRAENVVAVIPGANPALRGRYVIVGAHYDHLGRSSSRALDRERGAALRVGADDNASGTAVLLELGRRLAASPAPSTVVLAHFDAEEIGLQGSQEFVDNPPIPLDSVGLMLNLDMVGRLGRGPLLVETSEEAESFRGFLESATSTRGVALEFSQIISGLSDHASFARLGIPSIALFTGFHADYHRATDTPEKIDLLGLVTIIELAEAIVRSVGAR
jgi:Zn-dependent M28 family amino/carboxypeptidase